MFIVNIEFQKNFCSFLKDNSPSYGLASLIYEVQTWPQFFGLRKEIYENSSTVATKGIVVLPLADLNGEKSTKILATKESLIRQYSSQG